MIRFYFLQLSYLIFNQFQSNVTQYFFNQLKDYIFNISGQCNHSGQCCKSIMISKKGTPITTVMDWREFLNKNPQFERFTPTYFNGEIQSYDCSCLTLESMCSDYQNRPQMCIDYPRSYFNIYGKVHHGCGYYPEINYYWYQRLFKSIQMKMDLFFVSS